ncbi:MAG: hypothetical protein U0X20_13155 [Caldilineaceae bacterium]
MNTNPISQQHADLLDEVYKSALDGTNVPAATALEPDLAATAKRVADALASPAPAPAFSARLRAQLASAADPAANPAAVQSGRPGRRRFFNFSSPVWRIAAALVLVAAIGAWLLSQGPQPVSAQEIVRRAHASLNSPLAAGLQSYFIAEQTTLWAPSQTGSGANAAPLVQSHSEARRWFGAPDKWRLESMGEVYGFDGKPVAGNRWQSVAVSDGSNQYDYDVLGNVQTINLAPSSPAAAGMPLPASGGTGAASNLAQLFDRMADCYRPTVTGSALVAGRPVYVVDLGVTLCPSASAPEMNGREVLWVDKETFFVLKHELYSTWGDQLLMRSEVTDVQYNPSLGAGLFAAPAPPDARILDYRPQPLPAQLPSPAAPAQMGASDPQLAALLAALQPLTQRAAYPLFVPASIPAGLAPRLPKLLPLGDTGEQLMLEFVPAADVAQDTYAGQAGIRVTQQEADYATLVNFTGDAIPVLLPGTAAGEAWARRGFSNVDGTGTDSSVIVVRDGVLIALNSFTLSPEQLLEVAATMQTVPGSKPPLPAPQAPTLAQVRSEAPFPIYVPTWVPDGLVPDPPVGYEITYHDGSPQPVLTVTNGAGFADDPRAAGEAVTLANGTDAHWLGSLLWWSQDGSTTMAIHGDSLPREDLMRIAASMSATADLAFEPRPQPTPAPVLPTPTPMPTPSFAVQRPTWLPEEMKSSEQVDGSVVSMGFVPAGGNSHGALTLVQAPATASDEPGVVDPQASQESIGGHDVTVIRRGADHCVTYTWLAGGLRLTLTNVYDPPGELKYSCEQMQQIVAGIR